MAGVRKYGNPEKPKRQRKRKARTEGTLLQPFAFFL
jgi:hypothetical protein